MAMWPQGWFVVRTGKNRLLSKRDKFLKKISKIILYIVHKIQTKAPQTFWVNKK